MMQAAQIPAVCAAAPPVATDAREPAVFQQAARLARAGCAQRADDRFPALDGRAEAHRVEDVAAYLHHRPWQVRASRIAYQGSDVMSPLGGLGHGEAAEATGCPTTRSLIPQNYCHARLGLPSL